MNFNKVFGGFLGGLGVVLFCFVFVELDKLTLKSKRKSGQERVNTAALGCSNPAHSKERLLFWTG